MYNITNKSRKSSGRTYILVVKVNELLAKIQILISFTLIDS